MEILILKTLFALALLTVSLSFGLLIPWVLLKSRIKGKQPLQSNVLLETESLLPETSHPSYHTNDSSIKILNRKKNCFTRCKERLLKYDVISFINCCCGGLFLGICFLELLPESREAVSEILTKTNTKTSLPITEFFVTIGLIMVMLIEQSVNAICVKRRQRTSSNRTNNSVAYADEVSSSCKLSASNDPAQVHTSHVNVDEENIIIDNDNDVDIVEKLKAHDPIRSIVLVAMLSVHSIFEGLALGLESTVSNLVQLFIAISIHKSVLSFGLGMKLFETFTPGHVKIAVIGIFLFCSGSPLGSVIGILISLNPGNNSGSESGNNTTANPFSSTEPIPLNDVSGTMYATAILECLATGTFLYLTFIEVIPNEFSHDNHGEVEKRNERLKTGRKQPIKPMIKLGAFLLGFCIVIGLQFL